MRLADDIFISQRGRSGSFRTRFPSILKDDNRPNIHCAFVDDDLAGGLVTRHFEYVSGSRTFRATMIGIFCVKEQFRGYRIGRHLFSTVPAIVNAANSNFAVLWTTIQSYYEPLGWQSFDKGVFGDLETTRNGQDTSATPDRNSEIDWRRVETIRWAWSNARVVRTSDDYKAIPTSVTNVSCLISGIDETDSAYLLFGENADTAYVYELVGNPTQFSVLWSALENSFNRICINDRLGSESHQWLSTNTEIAWQPQNHAMWLARPESNIDLSNIAIPFFDRI